MKCAIYKVRIYIHTQVLQISTYKALFVCLRFQIAKYHFSLSNMKSYSFGYNIDISNLFLAPSG